jgi:hypothetical protein
MRWLDGKNRYGSLEHRLVTPEPVDLDAAYVELWRRVLNDAVALIGQADVRTIAFQLITQERAKDGPGEIEARFWNASNRSLKQPAYVLASETFIALDEGKSDEEHGRDVLTLALREYDRLRAVAAVEPVASLFRTVCAVQPLRVIGSVLDGWLDLRIGEPQPGPLPEYDQKLLAGMPAKMQPDRGGPVDPEWLAHLSAVSNAIVRYTPKHFQTIECTVRVEGNRLFYDIGCPDFPDEGTTEPGESLHQTMSRLIAYKLRSGGPFPGMRFGVQIESDGTARTQAAMLS